MSGSTDVTPEDVRDAAHRYLSDPAALTDTDLTALAAVGMESSARAAKATNPGPFINRALTTDAEKAAGKAPATLLDVFRIAYLAAFPTLFAHKFRHLQADKRIAQLERQVAQLVGAIDDLRKQRDKMLWQGVWMEGRQYKAGDACSWGGGVFIAVEDTSAKPGTSDQASRAWQLMVQRGREGARGPAGRDGACNCAKVER
jgi:hypothetical protein